ncbi:MAG: PAS domain-containing protein, partial [Gammaproteobacteria bacterium]|nr:PAS domain-containing protein [Gammaproteobacteria bacterium]
DIVAESSRPLLQTVIHRLKNGEQIPQYEAPRITKSGKIIKVSVTPTVLYSSYHKQELIAFTERDISTQHQEVKDESIHFIQDLIAMLEHDSEAVIVFEPLGQIVALNQTAETLYGWTRQELTDSVSIFELTTQQDHSELQTLMNELQNNQFCPVSRQFSRITKHNSSIQVMASFSLLGNTSNECHFIISREQHISA